MMTTITQHVWAAMIGAVLFSSCSRPVAYFQRGTAAAFPVATSQDQVMTTHSTVDTPPPLPPQPVETERFHETYVSRKEQLVMGNRVRERISRGESLKHSVQVPQRLAGGNTYRSMNRMERLMLKVMNRKISRQLAPKHPGKVLINSPIQAIGGGVLLIGGLLLLILGSGTVAFIGLILSLIGAVGVVVGLVGI